ncbi:hypothetical protein SVAN01_06994 [Stagonosporopsis vannaccii]|nr:hypothetical protein SVAN01_06994 [Stagonosporopsis vannaccii]
MPNLPTRHEFLTNGLSPLDSTCIICLEPFGPSHIAVRFTGPDVCCHVFGEQCLQQWVLTDGRNANRCPTCRRLLFRSESDVENEEEEVMAHGAWSEVSGDENEAAFMEDRDHEDNWSAMSSDTENVEIGEGFSGANHEQGADEDVGYWDDTEVMGSVEYSQFSDYDEEVPNGWTDESNDQSEDESGDEDDNNDNAPFPRDLRDITNAEQAYEFVEHLIADLRAVQNRRWRLNSQIRNLVRGVCQHFSIETLPSYHRRMYWRRVRLTIGRLSPMLRRPIVSEDELRRVWVPELARVLGW